MMNSNMTSMSFLIYYNLILDNADNNFIMKYICIFFNFCSITFLQKSKQPSFLFFWCPILLNNVSVKSLKHFFVIEEAFYRPQRCHCYSYFTNYYHELLDLIYVWWIFCDVFSHTLTKLFNQSRLKIYVKSYFICVYYIVV